MPAQLSESNSFNTLFFPQHVLLLSVFNNIMPMGYWTVISKEPFRFLICMQKGNYSYELLRKYQEAVLHFMPWSERERVVKAGNISGRYQNKAEILGFALKSAENLSHTQVVQGADSHYETVLFQELEGLSHEFGLFVLNVVAARGKIQPVKRKPILYLSGKDFASLDAPIKIR